VVHRASDTAHSACGALAVDHLSQNRDCSVEITGARTLLGEFDVDQLREDIDRALTGRTPRRLGEDVQSAGAVGAGLLCQHEAVQKRPGLQR
jgi:hypothetical protein